MQRERWLKSRTRPARSWALRLGWDLPLGLLEERVAPAVVRGAASAQPALPHILAPTDSVAASLRPDVGPDYYAIAIPAAGRWTVRAAPAVGSALDPALTLYGPDGQQLIDAHDAGPGDRAAALDLHLRPGTYLLRVAAQDAAAGAYQLQSRFDPAAPPFDAFPIEHAKTLLRTIFTYGRRSDLQDLNGDGRPDLVTLGDRTASVRLGLGDGTFQSAPVFSHQAESLLIDFTLADVDGDRRLDLVLTANDGFVRLLSGTGNGSFQFVRDFAFGFGVNSAAVGDMNGDGRADLVTANDSTNSIAITLADGRGGFLEPRTFAAGVGADNVRLADFNGDGRLDAVVANWLNRLVNDEGPGDPYGASVGVLLGNGDGTLGPMQAYDIVDAITVAVADFNRDGRPDLAVAGFNEAVMVLLGNGDGTFQRGATVVLGGSPSIVAARDVNGDGRADVVAVNDQSDAGSLDVLLGNGDGTFRVRRVPKTKFEFYSAALGDVNGDGRTDVVATSAQGSAGVLLGFGDGSFQTPQVFPTSGESGAVAFGDVNLDGRADVVSANDRFGGGVSVDVLLGRGDGTFLPTDPIALDGRSNESLAVTDLNGDGRPDLVVAAAAVWVLLGRGDGTFPIRQEYVLPHPATEVAVADVNGDGRPDLVTVNDTDSDEPGEVSVLLGRGDGTFGEARSFAVDEPRGRAAVAVGDLNGDGRPDLVTANSGSSQFGVDEIDIGLGSVTVLFGQGDGTFGNRRDFFVGRQPWSVALGDVNGDGRLDLVVAEIGPRDSDGVVSVLLGRGDGTFADQQDYEVETVFYLRLGDVNGDGRPDVVVGGLGPFNGPDTAVLLGRGDGTFTTLEPFAAGAGLGFFDLALGDANGDGLLDLVTGNAFAAYVSVLLGRGDGTFQFSQPDSGVEQRATPLRADLDRDGLIDIVVLNGMGDILLRRGLPGGGNLYAAPVVLNPGRPAREIALTTAGLSAAVAAADRAGGAVSLYALRDGKPVRIGSFAAGRLPHRLAAGDLNGDGRDDLVVADALGRTLTLAFQRPDGTFAPDRTVDLGETASDLILADLDGRSGLDVVVTELTTGLVRVLYNDAAHAFARTARFRADLGLSGLAHPDVSPDLGSLTRPVAVAAGRFSADALPDLAVLNVGSRSLVTLVGTAGGGFANPAPGLRAEIDPPAGPVVAADFTGDGRTDLAVLMPGRNEVWVYAARGAGTFTRTAAVPAGLAPTGLSAGDVDGDGRSDLLVGNDFGDVLFILGDGDGTFRPFVRTDQRVPFVATDLDGDGRLDVVLADQARDRVGTLVRGGTASFTPGAFQRDGRDGLIGPGAVAVADLDGASGTDLIFANSGSNTVLVYLRRPDGSFADQPLVFPVGTNPTGLTVTQLNDDTGDGVADARDRPDLVVADQGSNDVTVLLGDAAANGAWTFKFGPRLPTGGSGPNAVSAMDVTNDGVPDLLVTNGQDGTLATLPGIGSRGVGTGFFAPPAAPTPLAGGPVVQTVAGLNRGLAVTAAGGLVSFDPVNIAASAIALNHPVGAAGLFEQDGDTFAVTANRDGTLSVLESDGGVFRESVSVAVAGLTDPSALQVVGAGDGFLEVYVTEAGNGTPLALLVPTALGGALLPPVPDPGGGPVTTPTPLAPGSAAFIVVLLSPSLIAPDKEPATGDRDSSSELAGPAAAPVADGRVPAEQAGVTDGVITGGGADVFVELTDALAAAEGSEGVPTERPAELQQFITGWHEALERLGWHGRRPDEPKPPAEPKPSEAPAPPPTAARDTLISPQSPRFTVTEPGLQAPHAHPGQSDSSAGLPGSGMAVVALVTGLLYPGAIRGWTASVRPPCRPTVPARRARRRHDPR